MGSSPILSVGLFASPLRSPSDCPASEPWGTRIGAGMGVSRLAVRGLLPTVTFAINYDYIPASGALPEVHQVAGGVRAGVALPF